MKSILKYISFVFLTFVTSACNDSQSELLEPKVFFESEYSRMEVAEESTLDFNLQARISAVVGNSTEISYELGDESDVDAYNHRHGTEYTLFDMNSVMMDSKSSSIAPGKVYAEKVAVSLTHLDEIKEGNTVLLPIRIQSSSMPFINSRRVYYCVLHKPIRITKVLSFRDHGVKVGFPPATQFTSVTYEALIRVEDFGDNNTIIGEEGELIFRIGDVEGGLARDIPQIAGKKEFISPKCLDAGRWYHMAFSYDQPSGKAVMYINGVKVSEAIWDTPSFTFSGKNKFFIGKLSGFQWGERPLFGEMSEVRVWSVARTENQIRENMLSVDPKTEGLAVYYKMNGDDVVKEGEDWVLKDASVNGYDGVIYGGWYGSELKVVDLDKPLEIK